MTKTKTIDELEIRAACEQDLEQVAALSRQYLKEAEKPMLSGSTSFWTRRARDPDSCFLVAASRGEVIGYLLGSALAAAPHLRAEIGFLESVVVESSHSHLGVGQALMDRMGHWFMEKGVREIRTSVAAGNEKAMIFFEKLGFTRRAVQFSKEIGLNKKDV